MTSAEMGKLGTRAYKKILYAPRVQVVRACTRCTRSEILVYIDFRGRRLRI